MWTRRYRVAGASIRDQGFTLIEMLVVLTVLAIMMVVGVPSFRSFVDGQKVKAASFGLMSGLMLARSEAIKRNTPVTVAPATADAWISGWTIKVGTTTLLQQEALSGVTITKAASAASIPSDFIYAASGRLASASGVQYLQINGSSSVKCVKVDLTGIPVSQSVACP